LPTGLRRGKRQLSGPANNFFACADIVLCRGPSYGMFVEYRTGMLTIFRATGWLPRCEERKQQETGPAMLDATTKSGRKKPAA
jgi:hypothetical protein